ncbi:PhnD/SsuA/transferrin family substrate-binding protein [Pontibacter sp. G13]|uniref:PhnD/SsuA/transferrin family substrate-binding protein n=1 Tax=Pontibacter sp. G13 TaxID=3074898 RepID=UPI00288B5D16|nr:PhnD/SsuA/transferrin family substrate-binding protein [Pontibacter sp. G13]WNJ18499.1 PhnD/SsuA/transferrin family substrate-binding protein [Pontibacter sp. G13]
MLKLFRLSLLFGCLLLCLPALGNASDTLHVGLIRYKSPTDFRSTFFPLFEQLGDALNRPVNIQVFESDSADLGYALHSGEMDLGLFTQFPYLKASELFPSLTVFATHKVGGAASFEGAIVVRKSGWTEEVDQLADLRGKSFAFVKPTSTSGYKLPNGILQELGLNQAEGFFSQISFSGSHSASLEGLLDGTYDGVAVDMRSFKSLPKANQEKLVILRTYSVPNHAYVFGPNVPQSERNQILEAMTHLHLQSGAKAAFDNPLGISRWVSQEDEAYNSLRRYLNMVRSRAKLSLQFHLRSSAQKSLEAKGDLIEEMHDQVDEAIEHTGRFEVVEKGGFAHQLELFISSIDESEYSVQIKWNGSQFETYTLTARQLISDLPSLVKVALLENLPIKAPLLKAGDRWQITYGSADGLNLKDFAFSYVRNGREISIPKTDVLNLTESNTIFQSVADFEEDMVIFIRGVHADPFQQPTSEEELILEEGFWDNPDHVWGVIGLIVAILSVGFGAWFTRRKQKRFRNLLYSCNDLLKDMLEEQHNLELRLEDLKHVISRSLEKGHISENQFLILQRRLNDIEGLLQGWRNLQEVLNPELEAQIRNMLKVETITEREFNQLDTLLKRKS